MNLVLCGFGRIGKAFLDAKSAEFQHILVLDKFEITAPLPANVSAQRCDLSSPDELDLILKNGDFSAAMFCIYPQFQEEESESSEVSSGRLAWMNEWISAGLTFVDCCSRHMAGKNSSIVLVGSIQGVAAPKFESYSGLSMQSPASYSVIKSSETGIVRWYAKRFGSSGVRVNLVASGGILDGQPNLFQQRYRAECLTKGMLHPEDLADGIEFLLSDKSRFITGQVFLIDDGWHL